MKRLILALFIVLIVFMVIFLIYITDYFIILNKVNKENTENIKIENNTIDFSSLTLKQKISQMILVRGDKEKDMEMTQLNIGGIFLDRQKSKQGYISLIKKYQDNSKIKLIVSSDMEGTWNPFAKFQNFPKFSEIKNREEAYKTGLEEGKLMKEVGFNLNFAPVAEFSDEVYGGRVFSGSNNEIKEKLESYIRGLQENIRGACKHYPGRGMIRNLHKWKDKQEITSEDIELFDICFKNNISAVMIGHQIVNGERNSEEMPSSVSEKVISSLNFSGLIISDEVNMLGLKRDYLFNKKKMYQELINSGENLILDFKLDKISLYRLVSDIEKQAYQGKINEKKIDESVKKILTFKGYKLD